MHFLHWPSCLLLLFSPKKGIFTYLIAIIIGVVTITSWQIIGVQEGNWTLANLTDPLGISKITELKKVWSAQEKNTFLPGTETAILLNRLVWFGLSFGILVITYLSFRRSTVSEKKSKKKQTIGINTGEIWFTCYFNFYSLLPGTDPVLLHV